MIATEEDGKK